MTNGSEYVTAQTCVECDIRKCAYMLGDNKSVVDSSMIPHVKLHKWHMELSLHHVREAIAGDLILFHHINGTDNSADILSKHWSYGSTYQQLRFLSFFSGDPFNKNFSMADVEEEGNVDEAKSD